MLPVDRSSAPCRAARGTMEEIVLLVVAGRSRCDDIFDLGGHAEILERGRMRAT